MRLIHKQIEKKCLNHMNPTIPSGGLAALVAPADWGTSQPLDKTPE